jgi:hypothetical protein
MPTRKEVAALICLSAWRYLAGCGYRLITEHPRDLVRPPMRSLGVEETAAVIKQLTPLRAVRLTLSPGLARSRHGFHSLTPN